MPRCPLSKGEKWTGPAVGQAGPMTGTLSWYPKLL